MIAFSVEKIKINDSEVTMVCKVCSAQIADPTAAFCPNCGAPLNIADEAQVGGTGRFYSPQEQGDIIKKGNSAMSLGIVAIVLGLISPLVAWICGGIGLARSKTAYKMTGDERYKKSKGVCLAGIIVGSVIFVLSFIVTFAGMAGSSALF